MTDDILNQLSKYIGRMIVYSFSTKSSAITSVSKVDDEYYKISTVDPDYELTIYVPDNSTIREVSRNKRLYVASENCDRLLTTVPLFSILPEEGTR